MNDLRDKLVLVTGASAGIGRATAIGLAQRGARLLLTGRDPARCGEALAAVQAAGGTDARMFRTDFGRLGSVRQLAADIREQAPRLDILINNAALVCRQRTLTEDGFETTFAVNHLAPFLLTGLLLPLLGRGARVVNVASDAHRWKALDFDDLQSEQRFRSLRAYGQSKTANILWSLELARRLEASGVTSNSLHPGAVRSNMGRGQGLLTDMLQGVVGLFFKSTEKGAATSIYLAESPDVEGVTGRYFADCREKQPAEHAVDRPTAEKLWEVSETLVGFRYDFSARPPSP